MDNFNTLLGSILERLDNISLELDRNKEALKVLISTHQRLMLERELLQELNETGKSIENRNKETN